jgi:hypothetical protein
MTTKRRVYGLFTTSEEVIEFAIANGYGNVTKAEKIGEFIWEVSYDADPAYPRDHSCYSE